MKGDSDIMDESTKKVTVISAVTVIIAAIASIALVCKKLLSLLVENE